MYFEEILCDEVVLSDVEKAIVDECGDLDLVKLAGYSERVFETKFPLHNVDTASAMEIFGVSTGVLMRWYLESHDDEDWVQHTICMVLKHRSMLHTSSIKMRVQAAYVLCRIVFLEKMSDIDSVIANSFRNKWLLKFQMEDCWEDSDLEGYFDVNCGGENQHSATAQDFGWMFYDHEVNFANQFVSASSISHMASNPAFSITGSMAEYHWPELWKLYDKYVKLISSTDEGDVWLERVV